MELNSQIVIAVLVFFSVYTLFFLIRILADMYIVAIAIITAVIGYFIPDAYSEIRVILEDFTFLKSMHIIFPEQPDNWAFFKMAALITLFSVLICLPMLPFSQTYRQILGVERLSPAERNKIRRLVQEELQNNSLNEFDIKQLIEEEIKLANLNNRANTNNPNNKA